MNKLQDAWKKMSLDIINESKKVPSEFMNDPLYKKVLTAKNEKEYKDALDTLISVRGFDAVKTLQNAIKQANK